MAIRADCSYCGRIHKLGNQFAGRKIACVACQTPIDVPARVIAPPKPAPPVDETTILPVVRPRRRKPVDPPRRRQISLMPEESDAWMFAAPAIEAEHIDALEPRLPEPAVGENPAAPTDLWGEQAETVMPPQLEICRLPPAPARPDHESGETLSPPDAVQPLEIVEKKKSRDAKRKQRRNALDPRIAHACKLIGLALVIFIAIGSLFPQFVRRLERSLGLRPPRSVANVPPSTTALAAAGDATSLFPVSETPAPVFPEFEPEPGEHSVKLRGSPTAPGGATQLAVYIPDGELDPKSLPCILISPARTNLLTGIRVGEKDRAEHLPYLRAGYVVVCYSLDGHFDNLDANVTQAGRAEAYHKFVAAYAGLANARNALEFVLAKIPAVDPRRIYAAGHGSAATTALLFAEHEPRLRGCVAYVPVIDLETQYRTRFADPDSPAVLPGIQTLAQRMSPKTHAASLDCPVFLFYADNDSVNVIRDIKQFAEELQGLKKQVTLYHVPTGGHYDSMLAAGIPQATAWLQTLPGNRTAGLAAATRPPSQGTRWQPATPPNPTPIPQF
ncbi:MAG TPA: prolyl oligopeptidase family serine peptidase [Planctomycetaceae bacterium]|nr:prolyl oligopeptidase family serine peptidase [Planctomycetaceae bacterium]